MPITLDEQAQRAGPTGATDGRNASTGNQPGDGESPDQSGID
jgi:hypothetical protein